MRYPKHGSNQLRKKTKINIKIAIISKESIGV